MAHRKRQKEKYLNEINPSVYFFNSFQNRKEKNTYTGSIPIEKRTEVPDKIADFMTINRISIGKGNLCFYSILTSISMY